MGAWSVSITGNDTAQDLKSEYQAAFYYNNVDTALKKINQYIREDGFDESDESEWCDYYYSLADFMWRNGILTDEVKNEVLHLIDSGFGLGIWEESGQKALDSRKKALQVFRDKITSALPPKKKIKLSVQINPIFERGDIVAFQLQTKEKIYNEKLLKNIKANDFYETDGRYIVARKIHDVVSWQSRVEPNVRNVWAAFQLYNKIFDELPTLKDVINLKSVHFLARQGVYCEAKNTDGIFIAESSMFYFKKRKYAVIGNNQDNIDALIDNYKLDTRAGYSNIARLIFFGINKEHYHADAEFLNNITDR